MLSLEIVLSKQAWWLTVVIPDTWEVEIRRIPARDQLEQNIQGIANT
jgi:hypothetical protein